MCLKANLVADFSVRCHFGAAVSLGPFLGKRNEGTSQSVLSGLDIYKPAFEITYVVGLTIFGKWPDAGFEKARELTIAFIRYSDELHIRMFEYIDHLFAVNARSPLLLTQEAVPPSRSPISPRRTRSTPSR